MSEWKNGDNYVDVAVNLDVEMQAQIISFNIESCLQFVP